MLQVLIPSPWFSMELAASDLCRSLLSTLVRYSIQKYGKDPIVWCVPGINPAAVPRIGTEAAAKHPLHDGGFLTRTGNFEYTDADRRNVAEGSSPLFVAVGKCLVFGCWINSSAATRSGKTIALGCSGGQRQWP